MTIRPRPYHDRDLPALQAALAQWIHDAGDCGYCHVGDVPHRIYENLAGRGPVEELVAVWEAGSAVAGFAICGRFGDSFDVFASPELRGTDTEIAMLRSASEVTRRRLVVTDAEAYVVTDVFECDHTRSNALARLGFAEYRVWDHVTERSISGPIAEPALPSGFTIRPATMRDAEQLAIARNNSFDRQWSPTEYRDAVMSKPGYDPQREIVAVTPDGRIAAFTAVLIDEVNRVGLFEPVGTHREFQRRGLARAVMISGMQEMRDRGMTTASVGYDVTNQAAAELYRGLGFRKKHETRGYRALATSAS